MEKYNSKYELKELWGQGFDADVETGPEEDKGSLSGMYDRSKLALFKYAKTKLPNSQRASAAVEDCLRILDLMTETKYTSGIQGQFMRFVDKFFGRYIK